MILTGDSFVLAHGFSSENLVSDEAEIQRKSQELRESGPRSLDSSRSLALYQSNVNSGDHIEKKETKKYSSALAEVCPVRERDIRRKKKCIKKDVRHVKEVYKFNNNGVMNVLSTLSRSHIPKFLQPLTNETKDLQTEKMNQLQECASNMTKDDLEASTTKKIQKQEQLDEKSYKDHLHHEVLTWLQSMPILFSLNFTQEYLRDNVVEDLVTKIEKHSLASSGVNEAQLRNEIDNCVNSLPMRLPNNEDDRRLFKNGLRDYIYSNIIKLRNTLFAKRDGINNDEKRDKSIYVEKKQEITKIERKGLKEYDEYSRNRDISENGIEAIEIEIKSISNFTKTDSKEIKQNKTEEIERCPTKPRKPLNDVDDLYEKEINIWLDRMNYNKNFQREITVKLIIEKIKPFLDTPVCSISYKLKCSGAIIDVFNDYPIENNFPIEIMNPRIKTVYLNRLATKLAKRLMIVKVNMHLKEHADMQQCKGKFVGTLFQNIKEVINKKSGKDNLQVKVENKAARFENFQVTETKRLTERHNDPIHDIQEQILNEIKEDYRRVNAHNIAKDNDKLEAWTVKLLEEQKNMVREGEDLLKLSKALVYKRLSYVPSVISYEREILDWLQNLPLLPTSNESNEQRKIMQMISKLSEKISKRDALRSSDLNDNTADKYLIQYITDWISNLALDPRKPILVPILIQQLMKRIDQLNRKDDTSAVKGSTSKYEADTVLSMSTIGFAKNWYDIRTVQAESADIKMDASTKEKNKKKLNPPQFYEIPPTPSKDPGDLILEIVEDWCNELPINGDQLQKQIIIDNASTKIVMKICELNMDLDIFNNDIIYDQILDRELTNITYNLPASVDFRQSLPSRKKKILEMIKPVKTIIKERKQWLEYETKLNDTVINWFNNHYDTNSKDAIFNKLKDEVIDNFIQYLYNNNDEEAKLIYKNNLLNLVIENIADIKDKNEQVDPVLKQNQLLCELTKNPFPNTNMLKEKVEEIKIKKEVERLFNENGLSDTNKTIQIKNTLAKILNHIEKSGHTEYTDKKMNDTVVRYLEKIGTKLGSKVIYNFVNHLKYNEAARKTPRLNINKKKSSDASALFSSTPLTYPISRQQQTIYKHPIGAEQPSQYPSRDPSDQSHSCLNEWYPLEPLSPTAPGANSSMLQQIYTLTNLDNKISRTEQTQKVTPQHDSEGESLKQSKHTYVRTSERGNVSLNSDITHTLNHPNPNLQTLEQSESNWCQSLKHEEIKRDVLKSSKLTQYCTDQGEFDDGTYNQIKTTRRIESDTQTSDSDNTSERTILEFPAPELSADHREYNDTTTYSQIATPSRLKNNAQTSDCYDSYKKTLPEKTARERHNFHASKEQMRPQDLSVEKRFRYGDRRSKKLWCRMPSVIEETQTADSYHTYKRNLQESSVSNLRALNHLTNYEKITTTHQVEAQTSDTYKTFQRTVLESLKPDFSADQRAFSFKQIATPRRVEAQTSDSHNAFKRTLPESSVPDFKSQIHRQQREAPRQRYCLEPLSSTGQTPLTSADILDQTYYNVSSVNQNNTRQISSTVQQRNFEGVNLKPSKNTYVRSTPQRDNITEKSNRSHTSYNPNPNAFTPIDHNKNNEHLLVRPWPNQSIHSQIGQSLMKLGNLQESNIQNSSYFHQNSADQQPINKTTSCKQIATQNGIVDETQTSDSYNIYERTFLESSSSDLNANQKAFNKATSYKQIAILCRVVDGTQTSDSYKTYYYEKTLPDSSATDLNADQRELNDSMTYKQNASPHRVEGDSQTSDSYNTYERTLPEYPDLRLKTDRQHAESPEQWYSLELSSQIAQTPLASSSIPEQTYTSSTNQETYEDFEGGNLLNSTKMAQDRADQRELNDATANKQIATPRRVELEAQTPESHNSYQETLPESREQWYSLEPLSQTAQTPLVNSSIPEQTYASSTNQENYEDFKKGNLSNSTKLAQDRADQKEFNDATIYKQITTPRRVEDEAQTSNSYNTYEKSLQESSATDLGPDQRAFSDATTYKQIATPRRAVDKAKTSNFYNAYERTLPESPDLKSKTYRQQPESTVRKLRDPKEQKRKSQEDNYLYFCDRPLKKLCSRMYCVIPLDHCKHCGEIHPNRCSRCKLPRTDYMHCTWESS